MGDTVAEVENVKAADGKLAMDLTLPFLPCYVPPAIRKMPGWCPSSAI